MLRILKSLLVITAVAAIATGATGAYFTDSDTITANTLTTGTLDLTTSPTSAVISFSNLAPGWNYHDASHWGYDHPTYAIVTNTGSLPLKYRMRAVATGGTYDSNMLDEVLCQVAVDTGTPAGIVNIFNGKLGDLTNWHVLDTNFGPTGHTGWWGTGEQVRIYTAVPTTVGNELQGQSITFDIVFDSTQTDNPAW